MRLSSQLAADLIHLPNGLPTLAEVRHLDYLFSALAGKVSRDGLTTLVLSNEIPLGLAASIIPYPTGRFF